MSFTWHRASQPERKDRKRAGVLIREPVSEFVWVYTPDPSELARKLTRKLTRNPGGKINERDIPPYYYLA
jgi:hypothetical protein